MIHVYVDIGPLNTNGGSFVLLRTSGNTAFRADVSNPLGSATFNMHTTTSGTVVLVNGNNLTLVGNTIVVPESSAVLLGALGLVGSCAATADGVLPGLALRIRASAAFDRFHLELPRAACLCSDQGSCTGFSDASWFPIPQPFDHS